MTGTLREVEGRLRATLAPGALAELERVPQARVLGELAADWLQIAAAFVAVAWLRDGWAWLLAFAVIGNAQYRLFVMGHEGLHGTLARAPALNDALARWLVYAPLLVGFRRSRAHHLAHHALLGTAQDPERGLYTLAGKNGRGRFLLYHGGLATFAGTLRRVLWPGAGRPWLADYLPVLVVQPLLVLALSGLGLPWWAWAVLWLAPIYVFVFVPDEIRSFCDHAVLRLPDADADAARLITYRPSWFEAQLFAPRHVAWQAEHHLFPSIPHANLPRAGAALGPTARIETRASYIAFLRRAWRSLPLRA